MAFACRGSDFNFSTTPMVGASSKSFQAQKTPPGFATRIGASIQSGLTTPVLNITASHKVIMKADTPKFFVHYFLGSTNRFDPRNLGY
jgi:hypothetical protein